MSTQKKTSEVGILGGGQLGKMLVQSGLRWGIKFSILDPDAHAPCQDFTGFTVGSFKDYDTVLNFGRLCEVVTIEIEHVNTQALHVLVDEGKKVFPQPNIIELIQDKRLQKQFFIDQGIPTAPFICVADKADVARHIDFFPAINKLAREGYDGRGVTALHTSSDIGNAFDQPGILEKKVNIEAELAVLVARNARGFLTVYPPVVMSFDANKNVLDYLITPVQLSTKISNRACEIAQHIAQSLSIQGILAVEMFLSTKGDLLVNEIAPRPHNSGHHTIEASATSQYAQHLRAILDKPLGSVRTLAPHAAMVNLLGEPNHTGKAVCLGANQILDMDEVYLHLYGKSQTKPYRKMGHVTLLEKDRERLVKKIKFVKETIKLTT